MTPEYLQRALTEAGLSSTDLASALGLHQRSVDRWLLGEVPIRKMVERAILAVLEERAVGVSQDQVRAKTSQARRFTSTQKAKAAK